MAFCLVLLYQTKIQHKCAVKEKKKDFITIGNKELEHWIYSFFILSIKLEREFKCSQGIAQFLRKNSLECRNVDGVCRGKRK